MSDLNLIKLGDVATFRNGLNFSKSSNGQKIKIIGVSDFKDRLTPNYDELDEIQIDGKLTNEDYLHFGDIVFVRSNGNKELVARSLFIDKNDELSFSGFCIKARINNEEILLRKYFSYFTKTSQFRYAVSKGAIGTNINNLNQGILSDLIVPAPNIVKQNLVINFLSDLDAKIELNNRINTELESMTKLIYDYWFVQFDFPISAEQAQAMGKPELKGKPYKSSGGRMVYNEELKREIPEGWEVTKVKKVLKTDLGGTPSTENENYWNGSIPWLNSGEIANFPIINSELKITQDGINNSATTLMPAGSCVLSITRHLRPSILAVDSCVNQSVVGFFETDLLKYSYIYPYLVNEIPRLMSLRTGAQQPHINKGIVDASFILSPTTQILEKYYNLVDSQYQKIINNAFQNQKLSELRDWLLPMLMNGQVTVKEAEGYVNGTDLSMAAEVKERYKTASHE